jgi:hypothetical protein
LKAWRIRSTYVLLASLVVFVHDLAFIAERIVCRTVNSAKCAFSAVYVHPSGVSM